MCTHILAIYEMWKVKRQCDRIVMHILKASVITELLKIFLPRVCSFLMNTTKNYQTEDYKVKFQVTNTLFTGGI